MNTDADALRQALNDLAANRLDGAFAVFRADSQDPGPSIEFTCDGPLNPFDTVNEFMSNQYSAIAGEGLPVGFSRDGTGWAADGTATLAPSMDRMLIEFADGSTHELIDDDSRGGTNSEALDVGVKLLEPISVREIRGVERILSVIEAAIAQGDLNDFQERRIIAMAEVISEARKEAQPAETPRWRTIGVVRAGLRYAVKELPRDGLAFVKFVEILNDIGWTDLAGSLL